MRHHILLQAKSKDEIVRTIRTLEEKTSAEVVVTVRAISGHYRHTDWLVGFAFAFAAICVFIFHPRPFDDDLVPVEVLFAFALGALVSAFVAPFRRVLTSRRLMDENVRRAARAAFVDLGVSRTRQRTGLLIYVSLFEQRMELVADVGFDLNALGDTFSMARKNLETSAASANIESFLSALRDLGTALSEKLPRAPDDINELADEVRS